MRSEIETIINNRFNMYIIYCMRSENETLKQKPLRVTQFGLLIIKSVIYIIIY